MSVNRRSFLKSGALSALTAAFGLMHVAPALGQDAPKRKVKAPTLSGPKPQIPMGVEQSPLFYFTRETFEPYVGGVFVVSAAIKSVEMTLVAVTDCTPKAPAKMSKGRVVATDAFALQFSSPEELTDLTTIYNVRHGALGEFPLFLTRRDGPAGTSLYEAVFNHLL